MTVCFSCLHSWGNRAPLNDEPSVEPSTSSMPTDHPQRERSVATAKMMGDSSASPVCWCSARLTGVSIEDDPLLLLHPKNVAERLNEQ